MSWPAWWKGSSSGFRRGYGVVQRSESAADTWSSGDGAVHEVEAAGHRSLERPAQGKAGGDGGGESTPGAMHRFRVYSLPGEVADAVRCHQHVGNFVAAQVSSLDQRR